MLQVKARLMYCLEELAFEYRVLSLWPGMTYDGKMHASFADLRFFFIFRERGGKGAPSRLPLEM